MIIFEKISINDITPSEYNPRIITQKDKEILKNSLTEFGLVDPIIVNLKNNTIIGGHQRYYILKELGVTELFLVRQGDIGWIFLQEELSIPSDDYEKALNISLNQQAGQWNYEKLYSILDNFNEINFDTDLTGFDYISSNTSTDDFFDEDTFSYDFDEDTFSYDFDESVEEEEIIIKKQTRRLKIGTYSIELDLFKFNNWLRKIEFDNDFNSMKIINEIKRRLGFEDS